MAKTATKPNPDKSIVYYDSILGMDRVVISKELEERAYQMAIRKETVMCFQGGLEAILIESATGSGKTVMAFAIIHDMWKLGLIKTVGWITMRRELLIQAKAEMMAFFPSLEKVVDFYSLFDKEVPHKDMLVLDENRHEACLTAVNMINNVNWKFKLGLDATPYRTDSLKMQYQKKISNASARELIKQGFLAQVHQYTIEKHTPATVAAHYLAEPERWGKSVMYFNTEKQCNECADLLRAGGINCHVVTGNTDREQQIQDFVGGNDIQVLINMYILTEGFDYPGLRTVWVRDSTKGPVIQMAGRSFRPAVLLGKTHANVVQSGNTKYPISRYCRIEKKYRWDSATGLWICHEDNYEMINNEISRIVKLAVKVKAEKPKVKTRTVIRNGQEVVEIIQPQLKAKRISLSKKVEGGEDIMFYGLSDRFDSLGD